MRRSRIAALVALGFALVLCTPALAAAQPGVGQEAGSPPRLSWAVTRATLTDLLLEPGPFDNAQGVALMFGYRSSTFVLNVSGVDPAVAGKSFGAHLHRDACIATDGQLAGGLHYNITAINGLPPTEISDRTEVWLDFVVDHDGSGHATARVPWVPVAGEHAIVIHQDPTDSTTGKAGMREACLPLTVH